MATAAQRATPKLGMIDQTIIIGPWGASGGGHALRACDHPRMHWRLVARRGFADCCWPLQRSSEFWVVFVTAAPIVRAPLSQPQASVALATVEPRTFSVAGGASAANALSVPTSALFTSRNGALQVDVWSGGQAHATPVSIGLVGTNLTQITSGLQADEQVVLSPTKQSSLQLPSSPT